MAHRAPETIRLGVTQTSKGMRDLQDLLLKEQDALGVDEDGGEDGMRDPEVVGRRSLPWRLHRVALPDLLRLLTRSLLRFAALNIGVDKATLNRSGTEERGLGDEVIEGLRLVPLQFG
jgi:hypothetical protein